MITAKEYNLNDTQLKMYQDWVAQIPKKKYKNMYFVEWLMFGTHNVGAGIGEGVHVRREYKNGDVLIGDLTDYDTW